MRKFTMAMVSAALTLTTVGRAQTDHGRHGGTSPDPATVSVENQLTSPVVVYAEHGDFDIRLGSVAATSSRVFEIPSWLTRTQEAVTMFVRPAKGVEQSSGSVDIQPGEHIELIVPGRGPVTSRKAQAPTSKSEPTTVTVENELGSMVRVYAEHGSVDIPLGKVDARSSMTFEIPDWLAESQNPISIYVRPMKGQSQETGPLSLRRGEHLGVKVPQR